MKSKTNKLTINKNSLMALLSIFVFFVLILDYSVFYKIVLVILFLLTILLKKLNNIKITSFNFLYFLFLAYFVAHTLFGLSINSRLSMNGIFTMIVNLTMCLTISFIVEDKKAIEKVLKTYIVTAIIICCYVIINDYQNILSGELGKNVLKPFTNVTYSHNDISFIAAISVLFLSYFSIEKKPLHFSILLKIFFTIFIVLTGARKSLILCGFGLLIYPYLFSNNGKSIGKKIKNIFICIIAFIFAIVFMLKNPVLYELIGKRFEGFYNVVTNKGDGESSAVTRIIMRETAIEKVTEEPIIGYGLNTFQTFDGSFGTWSHNNYLEIAVSGGAVAVIIYYSIYIYFFISLYKLKKDAMDNMFLCFMFYMIIHDFLSISYISRISLIIFCLIQSKINISKSIRFEGDNSYEKKQ